MIVLVTGAMGYIGSHVCKALKEEGFYVIGLDRSPSKKNIMNFIDMFFQADYSNIDVVTNILYEYTPKAIVHLAGTSLVGPSLSNPLEYYTNNVSKTALFLSLIEQMKGDKPVFVFSSSAAVYGNHKEIITEESTCCPMNPYGRSKYMIEQMLKDCYSAYGLKSLSLRYFNACGADDSGLLGQEPNATHIIPRLIESVIHKKKFVLYGDDYETFDNSCIRDYVHVSDLARAHVMSIKYLLEQKEDYPLVMNLGSNFGWSNKEIIKAVDCMVGQVNLEVKPRREGDPDILVANVNLAKDLLGWEPKFSDLNTIIKSAYNWHKTL